MRLSVGAIAVLAACHPPAPAQAQPQPQPPASPASQQGGPGWLTIERSGCYVPTCPAYRLTLRRDGTVEYEGRSVVAVLGETGRHIEPSAAASMLSRLDAVDAMADPPACAPLTNTSQLHGSRLRVAMDQRAPTEFEVCHGRAYDEVHRVVKQIEREVDVQSWTGTYYGCEQFEEVLRFAPNRAGAEAAVVYDDDYPLPLSPDSWVAMHVREFARWGHLELPGFRIRIEGSSGGDEDAGVVEARAKAVRDLLLASGVNHTVLTVGYARAPDEPPQVRLVAEIPGCEDGAESTIQPAPRHPSELRASPQSVMDQWCNRCSACGRNQICGDANVCVDARCVHDPDCPMDTICDVDAGRCIATDC